MNTSCSICPAEADPPLEDAFLSRERIQRLIAITARQWDLPSPDEDRQCTSHRERIRGTARMHARAADALATAWI